MGWAKALGPPTGGGFTSPFLVHESAGESMKELSIFVDESGDFGCYDHKCPYYIVTMVMHEQQYDISANVEALNLSLDNTEI